MLRFKEPVTLVLEDGEEVLLPIDKAVSSLKELNELIIKAVYRKRKQTESSITKAATVAAWDCGFEGNSAIFRRNL